MKNQDKQNNQEQGKLEETVGTINETDEADTQELEEVLAEPAEGEGEAVTPEPVEVPTEEKEAKPKKKKGKEEEIVEERIYTIPLAKAWISPPRKRAPRAMHIMQAFITKHMKLNIRTEDEEETEERPALAISSEVNEKIWSKGIEKPPRKIRVRAAKDRDGNVTVYLAEEA